MALHDSRKTKHALYYLFDLTSIIGGFAFAFLLSFIWPISTSAPPLVVLLVLLLLLPVFHLAVGLYDSKIRENFRGVFRRTVIAGAVGALLVEVGGALLGAEHLYLYAVPTVLLNCMLSTAWRYWAIDKGGLNVTKRRVVVIGSGTRASFIASRMRRENDRKHYDLLGFLPLSGKTAPLIEQEETLLAQDVNVTGWKETLANLNADVFILANDRKEKLPVNDILDLKMQGVEVVELEDFVEAELGQIAVERVRPEWLMTSSGFYFNRTGADTLSYLFNAFLSLLVLFFAWPLMLMAALAIYLDDGRRDGAGILYRQIRVGQDGQPFEILKFRSMGQDAEKDGAQWATKNDMRVTRIGGFLRKYRIDELPQILNVLRGDMGFVGPRPERPEFVSELAKGIPYFNYRHCVKPGLTGWAQLRYPYGASEKDSFEKLKFDLYYIKHRSFLLDIFVLIRTVEIVLFGRGR